MKERAYAKINLALNVKGIREDKYHELEMIMLPLAFYDELTIEKAPTTSYTSNRSYIRFNSKNTVVKMIDYLKTNYQIATNFKVYLAKHIPLRAGLAGGSADAAATLRLIDKLCNLHLSSQEKEKAALAIGADVPFCLYNKPALVSGIGEKLQFFNLTSPLNVLLVKPIKGISTKEAFKHLNINLCSHPNVYALKKELEEGNYRAALEYFGNSLEQASFMLLPEIKQIKTDLLQKGLDVALMSGSGSTVFGLSSNKELLDEVAQSMLKKGYFVRKTQSF